jgi:hypothetical protein
MKRALLAAAMLGCLLPDPSWAQSNEPFKQGGRPPQGQNRPGPGQPGPQHPQPGPPPGRGPGPMHGGGPGPRPGYGRPTFVQPLPPRGNQFWHRGQYYGRVQAPPFAYPRGYGYRRWAIGAVLPPLLFAPSYFYPGYAQLGLQAPPPGYAWVRYGPDLILVNIDNGQVEDVVYGAFR